MLKYLCEHRLRSLDESLCDGNRLHAGNTPLLNSSLGTAGSMVPALEPGPAQEAWCIRSPGWIRRGVHGDIRQVKLPSSAAWVRAAGRECARCWSPSLCFRPWFDFQDHSVSRKMLQWLLSSESLQCPVLNRNRILVPPSNIWQLFIMLIRWWWFQRVMVEVQSDMRRNQDFDLTFEPFDSLNWTMMCLKHVKWWFHWDQLLCPFNLLFNCWFLLFFKQVNYPADISL